MFVHTVRTNSTVLTADVGIHKNVLESGATKLVISNEEINDIMKVLKSLGNSGIFLKGNEKTITNEAKEEKDNFVIILLCTFGVRYLFTLGVHYLEKEQLELVIELTKGVKEQLD